MSALHMDVLSAAGLLCSPSIFIAVHHLWNTRVKWSARLQYDRTSVMLTVRSYSKTRLFKVLSLCLNCIFLLFQSACWTPSGRHKGSWCAGATSLPAIVVLGWHLSPQYPTQLGWGARHHLWAATNMHLPTLSRPSPTRLPTPINWWWPIHISSP